MQDGLSTRAFLVESNILPDDEAVLGTAHQLFFFFSLQRSNILPDDQAVWCSAHQLFLLCVSLHLTIRADNDFYSLVPHVEQQDLSWDVAHAMPHLLTATSGQTMGQVFKTGLGSSACLVTGLVGALCFALHGDTPQQQQQHELPTMLQQPTI